jgi:hypothetical protein
MGRSAVAPSSAPARLHARARSPARTVGRALDVAQQRHHAGRVMRPADVAVLGPNPAGIAGIDRDIGDGVSGVIYMRKRVKLRRGPASPW